MRRAAFVSMFVLAILVLGAAGPAGAGRSGPDAYAPTDAERARWTIFDMRSLGIAMEAYRIDNGVFPDAATLEEAIAAIEPVYIRKAPVHDAWGTRFRYIPEPEGAGYTIVSAGADLEFADETWTHDGEAEDFNEDAVLRDGKLVRSWAHR